MLSSPANYAPSHLRPCSPWPRNQLRSVVTEDAPLTSTCLWGGVKHGEEAPREAWSERSKEVCIPMWSVLSDDNTPLIGQLIWWAELYCTLSASSSRAKRFFFFFCSTSLLYLVSKCIRVLAVLQKHVLVNSAPPSSTLHPSRSRISLGRTRGRARGSVGFSLPLHPR